MSRSTALANAHTVTSPNSVEISLTALKSADDAIGKPASITSTFSLKSCLAISIFFSVVIAELGDCSPSLKVVSNTRILFIDYLHSTII